MLLSPSAVVLQKPQPAKKEKKKEEDDGSRDLAMPAPEKKAPHPLAVMDKEAKSPFAGDTWKKVRRLVLVCYMVNFHTLDRLAAIWHVSFAAARD